MPTYAELQQEPQWAAEFIPPNLRILVTRLQAFYDLGWTHIGCKGDNRHLRGYHRSRNWILASDYCTNRTYSVSRTVGDRSGGNGDWLCALDATIPRAPLLAACQRLDAAVRAGKLEKLTEWYGNTDGDDRVDGYDNISNQVATSDDSHLWHLHLSFDRGRADEDHTDLYEILTGDDDDMLTKDEWATVAKYDELRNGYSDAATNPTIALNTFVFNVARDTTAALKAVARLEAKVDALPERPPVDPAALKAALLDPEVLAALEDAAFRGAQRAETV
jgi:hypothetical protein